MSTDYTLPPVPRAIAGGFLQPTVEAVEAYGQACAEAARAPLLARIAELEADLREYRHGSAVCAETLKYVVTERDRLRAEVEALRDCLRECADDLEAEVTARASGEMPRRIERDLEPVRKARALLEQPAGSWVNPLAAEVEALRADAERYRYLRDSNDFETLAVVADYTPTSEWDRRIDAAIAAQRGEGE